MHQLNLAKIIEIYSNLGRKEPSPRFQARFSLEGFGLDFRYPNTSNFRPSPVVKRAACDSHPNFQNSNPRTSLNFSYQLEIELGVCRYEFSPQFIEDWKKLEAKLHCLTWVRVRASIRRPNCLKRGWFCSKFQPRFAPIDTSFEGGRMGGVLQLWVVEIGCQIELWSRVNGGGEEEKGTSSRERKRETIGLSRVRRKKERGSRAIYQNAPPLLYSFVPSWFIFDTANLIRNPNSKPKSII